jgi:hypothetical protein
VALIEPVISGGGMSDSNVTHIGAKPDRLGQQLNMREAMQAELRQVLAKYTDLWLMQIFISDAFAEVDAEARMGPLAVILDGGEPA